MSVRLLTDADGMIRDLSTPAHDSRPSRPEGQPIDCGDLPFLIKRDGTWLYRGDPIRRKELIGLFASVLERKADGSYWLQTPSEVGRIEVEDAPFVAVAVDSSGNGSDQRLTFRTNIGEGVIAGPEHPIRVVHDPMTGDPTLYLLVRPGIEARINRSVYLDLVAAAATQWFGGRQRRGLWSLGQFFPLSQHEAYGVEADGSPASHGFADRAATPAFDLTHEIEGGVQALDAHASELLAVAHRAARRATERGGQIGAMLVKIREARAEMAVD